MANPLTLFPESCVLLSPAYYGSVDYYATLAKYGKCVIDYSSRFDKRLKSTHRTVIADVNRELNLTFPIEKPVSMTAARWGDIRVSHHGEWWHVHRVSIESAYGRTPFFEFYADKFADFLRSDTPEKYPRLADLNIAINDTICKILGIDTEITFSAENITDAIDCRGKNLPLYEPVPYYQVRQGDFGFIPHLSILDLIFNMGPESPLVLQKMSNFAQ